MSMDSNTVHEVTLLCLFVLTDSHLGVPLGLSNVSLAAPITEDFVGHTSPLSFWNVVLDVHQGLFKPSHELEDFPDPEWGADPFQFFIQSSDVRDTQDPCGGLSL